MIEIALGGHAVAAILPIDRKWKIAAHDGYGTAKAGLLTVSLDQSRKFWIAGERGIGNQRVERSGGLQELCRRFFAHAGNSGKIIGRIAFEPAIIGQLTRFEAETFANRRRIVAAELRDAAPRRQNRRAFADDLQKIEIAGNHERLLAGLLGLASQRRDNVVGFLPLDLDDRNAIGLENAPHQRKLTSQLIGHDAPLSFVLGEKRDAIDRHALIESGENMRRLLVGDQLVEHHRKTVDGVDRCAFAGREAGKREESPVDQAVGVEEHQGHRGVLPHDDR